jgi:membrane fusion protein, multidrug efflux system
MRTSLQFAVLGLVVALGAGGWYGWQYYAAANGNGGIGARPAQTRGGGPIVVETVKAQLGRVAERVEGVGSARANESITLTSRVNGFVSKIEFEEGKRVKRGDILVELEAAEQRADVDQARADLEQAQAAREDAKIRLERARALRETGNATDARLDEATMQYRAAEGRVRAADARIRVNQAKSEQLRITAPFDGRVGLRLVSLGALIQPGTAIATLDDVITIKVETSLPETVMGKLELGLPIVAKTSAYPDRKFVGKITALDTRVDPVTRSIKVHALFDNSDEALKPGLFMTVELELGQREGAVMVPEEAIAPEGTRAYVFVVRDGRANRREVGLGQRVGTSVQILKGIEAGDEVVVAGTEKLRDRQPVAARPATPTS